MSVSFVVEHGLWIFGLIMVLAVLPGVLWARFSAKRALRYTLRQRPKVELSGLAEPSSSALRELSGVLEKDARCQTVRNTKSMHFESTSSNLAMTVDGARVELAEPADILLGTSEELGKSQRTSTLRGGDEVKAYGVLTRQVNAADYRGAATLVLEGDGKGSVSLVAATRTRYQGLWDWAAVLGRVLAMLTLANIAVFGLGEYAAKQLKRTRHVLSSNPANTIEAKLATVSPFHRDDAFEQLSHLVSGSVPMSPEMGQLAVDLMLRASGEDAALQVAMQHGLAPDSGRGSITEAVFPRCAEDFEEPPRRELSNLAAQGQVEALRRTSHTHTHRNSARARVFECIKIFHDPSKSDAEKNAQLREMSDAHRPCRALYLAKVPDTVFDPAQSTFETEPFGAGFMLLTRRPKLATPYLHRTLNRAIRSHVDAAPPTYWPLAQRALDKAREAGDESRAGQLLLAGVELRVAIGDIVLGDFASAEAGLVHVESVLAATAPTGDTRRGDVDATQALQAAELPAVSPLIATHQLLQRGLKSARFRLALYAGTFEEASELAAGSERMRTLLRHIHTPSFGGAGKVQAAIQEGSERRLLRALGLGPFTRTQLEHIAMVAKGTPFAQGLGEHLRHRIRPGDCGILDRFERVSFERRVAATLGHAAWLNEASAQQAELLPLFTDLDTAAVMDALGVPVQARPED